MATFKEVLTKQQAEDMARKESITGQDIVNVMLSSPDVKKVLVLTEDVLKQSLKDQQVSNTGESGNLRYEINVTGIKVYAVYYLYVLQEGANYKDKMPPVEAILKWVNDKGIGGSDPESVAFAVAKSIQRHGLKPHPDLLKEWEAAFRTEMKKVLAKSMKEAAKKYLTGGNKFKK